MFGSFLPSLWSSSNQSVLRSREPTLLCNQVKLVQTTCPVRGVDSMGRRNTKPKSPYKGLNSWESFASVDRSGTPSWLGSDWLQTGKVLLHGEVLSDQLTNRPLEPAALIGNLN